MGAPLERRMRALEARFAPLPAPPRLLVGEPGETKEDALLRVFGDDVPVSKAGKPPSFILAVGVGPIDPEDAP